LLHIRFVGSVNTVPCKSLRHKSFTLHMFISNKFTNLDIDKTNKTHQKVMGSKFMFKISTIRTNTCVQTTTLVRNHCRDDGWSSSLHSLSQQTFNYFTSWIREQ